MKSNDDELKKSIDELVDAIIDKHYEKQDDTVLLVGIVIGMMFLVTGIIMAFLM